LRVFVPFELDAAAVIAEIGTTGTIVFEVPDRNEDAALLELSCAASFQFWHLIRLLL
jgi:hypothetical protein